jgi:hypothetical protein
MADQGKDSKALPPSQEKGIRNTGFIIYLKINNRNQQKPEQLVYLRSIVPRIHV